MAKSKLRQLREAAGLSQRELARLIGEQQSNVRYWEVSGNLPRSNVVAPMAKALGVSLEELLGESVPKRAQPAGGKLGAAFYAAQQRLPRRQQEKLAEFVQVFVAQHANGS